MKGKIAFVLGAAVGYVLGTRAGRERYEQIKRGAQTVWNTPPVQRGVELVRDAVDERAEEAKLFARRVVADVFSSVGRAAAGDSSRSRTSASSSRATDSTAQAERATAPAKSGSVKGGSGKSGTAKGSASKSKSSSAKSGTAKGGASKTTKRVAASDAEQDQAE